MAPEQNIIYAEDAIHMLQVSEEGFDSLIKTYNIQLNTSEMGLSMSKENFRVLLQSKELPGLVEKALRAVALRRELDGLSNLDKKFQEEIDRRLLAYRAYIKTIESIHVKYHDKIDPLHNASPESAAYILFANAISQLKMAIDSLADRHFGAIALLRHIDEAIALAEYFLIERNSIKGKDDLSAWFHENRSPSNSTCRESISKWASSIPVGNEGPSMESVLKTLYRAKSKPVHNAHHSIMETYKTETTKEGVKGVSFDYGASSNPRKLHELVEFYQSTIWTLTQAMLMCFSGLAKLFIEEDNQTLQRFNVQFFKEMQQRQ